MKAMDAVKIAKEHIAEMLSDEGVINIGLEEIEYDEGERVCSVTVGFSRPWDKERSLANILGRTPESEKALRRDYKILKVGDADGAVTSVRIRDVAA